MSHSGRGNFIVWAVSADGTQNKLLANDIGRYEGTVLFDEDDHSVAFSIQANGPWEITISPLARARAWDLARPISGEGDDVLRLEAASSGLTTVEMSHRGRGNFIVWAFTASGRTLLANEIGRFDGQALLADGTLLLEINADGSWSIAAD